MSTSMRACIRFFRREPVLVIAAIAAVVSMIFIPPSAAYAEYIDWRVLCLLFCLMAVVAGLQKCGLFAVLAQRMLTGKKRMRFLSVVLVLLPFLASMFITNDVALITFVPFAILVLELTGQLSYLIYIVALQTVAANLGSMLMPVGNPQNLFLYARFQIPTAEFFAVMLPLTLLSLILVCAAALFVKSKSIEVHFQEREEIRSPRKLALFTALFLLCLLCVFRVLPDWLLLGIIVLCLLVFDRDLFRRVDYGLLATFIFFFVFAGNIGNIPAVRETLTALLQKNSALVSAAASQVISNVPAAVLLSGFTDNWRGLLVGTNLGGLGTLIASLASLISFKFYCRSPGARPLRYFGVFTVVNVCGLVLLFAFAFLIGLA